MYFFEYNPKTKRTNCNNFTKIFLKKIVRFLENFRRSGLVFSRKKTKIEKSIKKLQERTLKFMENPKKFCFLKIS